MRKLQLTLRLDEDSHTECRAQDKSYIDITRVEITTVPEFLQSMQRLATLVLSLSHNTGQHRLFLYRVHLPALRSLDVSGDKEPHGFVRFLETHSSLLHTLRLRFEMWLLSFGERRRSATDHMLLELRALMVDENNGEFTDDLLGKRTAESADATCARRPRFEHLRVHDIRTRSYLTERVQPLGRMLRRLDLQFLSRRLVFEEWFTAFLESFTALVELSITLRRADPAPFSGNLQPVSAGQTLSEDSLVSLLILFHRPYKKPSSDNVALAGVFALLQKLHLVEGDASEGWKIIAAGRVHA